MKATRADIQLYTDSAFHELFKVINAGAPQDFTGWEFKMVFADSYFTAVILEGAITPNADGTLLAHIEPALLEALLPASANQLARSMTYVLKAKPAVTYPVRLFYGSATLNRGLPPWL